jgi:outer membrane protein assembly factor BamB
VTGVIESSHAETEGTGLMPKIEDWHAALRHPGFWHEYLASELDGDDGYRNGSALSRRLFGPSAGFDSQALFGRGEGDFAEGEVWDEDSDSGSVLTLRFPRGYKWCIAFSTEGIFHSLDHERMPQSLLLGYDDPHFHLPILRWPEVFELAAQTVYVGGRPETPLPSGVVMALLAPVTYGTTEREVAYARRGLAEGLATAGLTTPDNADEAAEALVSHVGRVVWRPDPALGWINNGTYSHRNPTNGHWSPVDFWRFRQFIAGPRAPRASSSSGREPVWQIAAGGPVGPGLTASDDTVLFTTWPGTLHAVEARSGSPLWRVQVPEPGYGRAAPVLAGDTVYYAGGERSLDLVCLPRWGSGEREASFTLTLHKAESRYSTSYAYHGRVDVTPVIAGKTVIVAGDWLHARWLGPTGPQAHWDTMIRAMTNEQTAPAVDDHAVYIVLRDYYESLQVHVYDLATGSERWRLSMPGVTANRPVVEGGELFVAGRSLLALDPSAGTELWSVQTEREYIGAIAATATHVVGATGRLADLVPGDDRPEWSYTVVCVDRRTRTVAWTFTDETRLASSGVAIADGVVYSVGHDDHGGTLYALELATGRLAWQVDIGRSSALPAVAAGLVCVSNMEGKVAAFPTAAQP